VQKSNPERDGRLSLGLDVDSLTDGFGQRPCNGTAQRHLRFFGRFPEMGSSMSLN